MAWHPLLATAEIIPISVVVMPIPVVIAAIVIWKSIQAWRAAKWPEAQARIVQSRVALERRRAGSNVGSVKNKALVVYEFRVDGKTIRGKRIGVGAEPMETVGQTLKRFPVGAMVPVYYDPRNPNNCLLDRSMSVGCALGGIIIPLLLGSLMVALIAHLGTLDGMLVKRFPTLHHPTMAICIGFMGGFCWLLQLGGKRLSAQSAHWPITKGSIVSSKVESYQSSDSSSSGSMHYTTMYKAVVEYRYSVDGQEYHSTQISAGGEMTTSVKAVAEAQVAKYTKGQEVEVHYNPEDPVNAVISTEPGSGAFLLIMGAALLALAVFVARHA